MRKTFRTFAFSLFVLLLAPAALFAEKSLFWRRLDVAARLDAQGALHVAERQAIVFTGDWNGGERKFRIRPGQKLRFLGISRQDENGQMRSLAQGSLSDVDRYAFTDPTTLRWRSRLPSDPQFEQTEILYELDYELSGILLREGGTYVLDHDFAFPDRSGRIEVFTLDLSLDPAWKARHPVPLKLERGPLPPGASVVVRAELEHTGGAKPSAVRLGTSRAERLGLFLLFLGAVLVLAVAFYRRESRLGRFAPLPPPEAIDASWLERKIFTLRPEEVGALWDEAIGPPEVAAVLARLAAEKKISTGAEGKKLTMRLLVPLASLEGYDKKLLEALFFNGREETDTDAIRAHYKSSGFDPASKIKEDLEKRLSVHADFGDRSPRPGRWPTLILLVLGLGLIALAAVFGGADPGAIVGAAIVYGIPWGIALIPASFWQKRMHNFLLPALAFLWLPAALLYSSYRGIGSFGQTALAFLAGLLLLKLAIVNNLFNVAKTRNGPHRIARRKTLVAAREFFARELTSPAPRLEDRWFPYIVAFGLSSGVERWFRAYGREQAVVASRAAGTSSSGGSSASPSGGWTGGGGSFGGAGASASWAAAAGALAAGVSAPSSGGSGGGGGGGGGGSSGGGGGGGW
jgi:uncharacterized membrane protein YgcG